MQWEDVGYLLYKTNYSENSIFIDVLTLEHGLCRGIVYGGNSKKIKNYLQIGNKISLFWKSKGENRNGYFTTEIIDIVSPFFFNDKKRTTCILSATSILKILLAESQVNKNIYHSFDELINNLSRVEWILNYILWEQYLVKELGFDMNLSKAKPLENNIKYSSINVNDKFIKFPNFVLSKRIKNVSSNEIYEALIFNKKLLLENFIEPNRLKLPLSRNLLETYFL